MNYYYVAIHFASRNKSDLSPLLNVSSTVYATSVQVPALMVLLSCSEIRDTQDINEDRMKDFSYIWWTKKKISENCAFYSEKGCPANRTGTCWYYKGHA